MKNIAILGIAGSLILSLSATNAVGDVRHIPQGIKNTTEQTDLFKYIEAKELEEKLNLEKIAEQQALEKSRAAIKNRIKELQAYVNRTSYVFSGSTPLGWDCSGLTKWFYDGLGVELDHSASKQGKYAGRKVDTPIPGDIVAFKHVNSDKYYHVGIYVGNNKVIHAKKPGTKTEKIELTDSWFAQSEISFIRVIEN